MRTAQRQHLNLSNLAYETIESDIAALRPGDTLSGFVNDLFLAYFEEAEASITLAAPRLAAKHRSDICRGKYRTQRPKDQNFEHYNEARIKLSAEDENTIAMMVRGEQERLALQMRSFSRDVTCKIRLNNETYDMLYPEDGEWPEATFYQRPGDYLKAVVEEYARKPFFEREGIFCTSVIAELENECSLPGDNRRIVCVAIGSGEHAQRFDVKPYAVLPDTGHNYHYLVGLSKPLDEPDSKYAIASFRISRITRWRFRAKSHGSGKITRVQEKEIEEALGKRGVQYLLSPSEIFKVALTETGMHMYRTIIHMRPLAIGEPEPLDERSLLRLECTEKQLTDYFFRFGAEAIILDRPDLSDNFHERYQQAADAYSLKH